MAAISGPGYGSRWLAAGLELIAAGVAAISGRHTAGGHAAGRELIAAGVAAISGPG